MSSSTVKTVELHKSWKNSSPLVLAIMTGEHDDQLDQIAEACRRRLKYRFYPGQRIRLTSEKLAGKEGIVLEVSAKRLSVGVGELVTKSSPTQRYNHETQEWDVTGEARYEVYEHGTWTVHPDNVEPVEQPKVVLPS